MSPFQDFRSDSQVRQLANRIASGDCMFFVGAGLSVPAGLPTWRELEEAMKLEASIQGNYGAPRVADCCREAIDGKAFLDLIRKQCEGNFSPTRVHRLLAQLPGSIYITTNFDTLIEDSLTEVCGRDKVRILVNSNPKGWLDVTTNSDVTWVLKVHGCVRADSGYVIGENDFVEYYERYPHVVQCLSHLFGKHSVLFVGYSLSDWNIAQLLYRIQVSTKNFDTSKYFVGIRMELPVANFFRRKYGLHVINLESSDVDIEESVARFFKEMWSLVQIPLWLSNAINAVTVTLDNGTGLSRNSSLHEIVAGFDATLGIRLGLAIERELGIQFPLEELLRSNIKLSQVIEIGETLRRAKGDFLEDCNGGSK